MTYEEVADNVGMDKRTKNRYVLYMKERWSDTEQQKCRDGYAEEWAWRFMNKREYRVSDGNGLAVLKEIDGDNPEKR